jgi:hypothetical protein
VHPNAIASSSSMFVYLFVMNHFDLPFAKKKLILVMHQVKKLLLATDQLLLFGNGPV